MMAEIITVSSTQEWHLQGFINYYFLTFEMQTGANQHQLIFQCDNSTDVHWMTHVIIDSVDTVSIITVLFSHRWLCNI